MEASGTSGMKATFNGGLQLSVLDGWWAEAYDGENGWAIPGDGDGDHDVVDDRDAARLYDLLEHEVIPLFYDRDANGVPQAWCERIKHALVRARRRSARPAWSTTTSRGSTPPPDPVPAPRSRLGRLRTRLGLERECDSGLRAGACRW